MSKAEIIEDDRATSLLFCLLVGMGKFETSRAFIYIYDRPLNEINVTAIASVQLNSRMNFDICRFKAAAFTKKRTEARFCIYNVVYRPIPV